MNFWNNGNMIKLVIYYIIWILQLHLSMFLGVGKRKKLSDIVKKYINNNHKTVFDENWSKLAVAKNATTKEWYDKLWI